MPTFERTTKKYYTISKEDHPNGLIRYKDPAKNIHHYGGLEGILTSIKLVEDEFEGETQMKYQFKFEPEGHDAVDILQIGETASAARGLLMTLVSCPGQVGWVSVSPYRNQDPETGKTYTNLWTEVNGETVEWRDEVVDNLPDVEEVMVGDKRVLDDSARRQYVRKLARRVMDKKLAGKVLHDRSTEKQQKSQEQPDAARVDGAQQAKDTYGSPSREDPPKQTPPKKSDEIDMSNFDDIDDDLPFSWVIILITAGSQILSSGLL